MAEQGLKTECFILCYFLFPRYHKSKNFLTFGEKCKRKIWVLLFRSIWIKLHYSTSFYTKRKIISIEFFPSSTFTPESRVQLIFSLTWIPGHLIIHFLNSKYDLIPRKVSYTCCHCWYRNGQTNDFKNNFTFLLFIFSPEHGRFHCVSQQN